MKKQITSISPFQTAKVFAVLYFIMSLPFLLVMAIPFSLSPFPKPGMLFLIFVPVFYMIGGFLFTAIGAWAYNLAAKWVGGMEYTAVEIEGDRNARGNFE